MTRRRPGLTLLLTVPAMIAGCAAGSTVPPTAPADTAATPASIVFGSCPQRPAWPEAARQEKRQGTVALAFQVDADSTVLDAKVKNSSGHADLDEAARVGLAKCKFRAARKNGQPVRDWAQVSYRWMLE